MPLELSGNLITSESQRHRWPWEVKAILNIKVDFQSYLCLDLSELWVSLLMQIAAAGHYGVLKYLNCLLECVIGHGANLWPRTHPPVFRTHLRLLPQTLLCLNFPPAPCCRGSVCRPLTSEYNSYYDTLHFRFCFFLHFRCIQGQEGAASTAGLEKQKI